MRLELAVDQFVSSCGLTPGTRPPLHALPRPRISRMKEAQGARGRRPWRRHTQVKRESGRDVFGGQR
jgi:hypothetical protein